MSKVEPKILIVDDEEINRAILRTNFEDKYGILEAADGEEAIDIIKEYKDEIVVILLDIIMPKLDGFGVLKFLNKEKLISRLPVVLITGDSSACSDVAAFDLGVVDVIQKPFNPFIVNHNVQNVIELYNHKKNLEKMVKKQTSKIEKQAKKLRTQKNQITETLSTVVEFRNLESGEHVKRIQNFTRILLECVAKMYPEYKLTPNRIESIVTASALHDVGKIAVPDNILLKPGKLTQDEFDVIKMHTIRGCEIIDKISFVDDKEFFKDCYDICRHHHEKYDGKGYPDGLAGDNIPISAQVVAIADVYDALVSERVYKKAFSKDKAYDMIVEGDCGVFNPKLLECLKKVKKKLENMADKLA